MPYYPKEDNKGHDFEIESIGDKLVSDYGNMSFFDIQYLDIDDYMLLRRDAFIHLLSQTDEGNEYLENAWRLQQTEPDRKALREHFGGERRPKA